MITISAGRAATKASGPRSPARGLQKDGLSPSSRLSEKPRLDRGPACRLEALDETASSVVFPTRPTKFSHERSGRPRQFVEMKENRQCSTLFPLLVARRVKRVGEAWERVLSDVGTVAVAAACVRCDEKLARVGIAARPLTASVANPRASQSGAPGVRL